MSSTVRDGAGASLESPWRTYGDLAGGGSAVRLGGGEGGGCEDHGGGHEGAERDGAGDEERGAEPEGAGEEAAGQGADGAGPPADEPVGAVDPPEEVARDDALA